MQHQADIVQPARHGSHWVPNSTAGTRKARRTLSFGSRRSWPQPTCEARESDRIFARQGSNSRMPAIRFWCKFTTDDCKHLGVHHYSPQSDLRGGTGEGFGGGCRHRAIVPPCPKSGQRCRKPCAARTWHRCPGHIHRLTPCGWVQLQRPRPIHLVCAENPPRPTIDPHDHPSEPHHDPLR